MPISSAPPKVETRIINALTVDVEDYFQVSAMAPYIARSDWDRIPCRIEKNIDTDVMRLLLRNELNRELRPGNLSRYTDQ